MTEEGQLYQTDMSKRPYRVLKSAKAETLAKSKKASKGKAPKIVKTPKAAKEGEEASIEPDLPPLPDVSIFNEENTITPCVAEDPEGDYSATILDLKSEFQKHKNYNKGQIHQEMIKFRDEKAGFVNAWVVTEGGKIISEWYNPRSWYGEKTKFHIWSGTKLITGLMYAIMHREGQFASNQKLSETITGIADFDNYWEYNKDKGDITLQELLKMTSGLVTNTRNIGGCIDINWLYPTFKNCGGIEVDSAKNPDYDSKNKGVWNYLMANNLLSYAMQNINNTHPAQYAQKYLFPLLGINNFQWWEVDGVSTSFHGARLTVRDFAKIGQFALQGGVPTNKIGEGSLFSNWWFNDTVERDLANYDYNAGFYNKNKDDNERAAYIDGLGGKHLYWQNTTKGGRVYAIISVDNVVDSPYIGGQKCWPGYCSSYSTSGFATESEKKESETKVPPSVSSSDRGGNPLSRPVETYIPDSRQMREFAQKYLCYSNEEA